MNAFECYEEARDAADKSSVEVDDKEEDENHRRVIKPPSRYSEEFVDDCKIPPHNNNNVKKENLSIEDLTKFNSDEKLKNNDVNLAEVVVTLVNEEVLNAADVNKNKSSDLHNPESEHDNNDPDVLLNNGNNQNDSLNINTDQRILKQRLHDGTDKENLILDLSDFEENQNLSVLKIVCKFWNVFILNKQHQNLYLLI